jgi:hypothetical protein
MVPMEACKYALDLSEFGYVKSEEEQVWIGKIELLLGTLVEMVCQQNLKYPLCCIQSIIANYYLY